MLAWPLPGVAAPIVGAPGTVFAVLVVLFVVLLVFAVLVELLPPPPPPQAANRQRLNATSAVWNKGFIAGPAFFGFACLTMLIFSIKT